MNGLDGEIERGDVSNLQGGTFLAVPTIHSGDNIVELDARPAPRVRLIGNFKRQLPIPGNETLERAVAGATSHRN